MVASIVALRVSLAAVTSVADATTLPTRLRPEWLAMGS